eukprot:2977054-Pleurochrysis_carterae.AAC.2
MLRFAVHAGNDLIRATCVHEIAGVRMDVPRATAVDYKRDSFASAATCVTTGDATFSASQEGTRCRCRASCDDSRACASRSSRRSVRSRRERSCARVRLLRRAREGMYCATRNDLSEAHWVHDQRDEVVDNVVDQQIEAPGRGAGRHESS